MAKKKAKQKHKIPGEYIVSLPRIPGVRISEGDSNFDRINNLIAHACSTVLYARKKRLSQPQKDYLSIAFRKESSYVLGLVGNMAQSFEGTSGQDHINFFGDYKRWCERLEKYVKKSLDDNTASLSNFLNLYHSLMNLLVEARLLAGITADTLNEATRKEIAILAKELHYDLEADLADDIPKHKKATDTGRKKKQKKPQKNVKDRFSFAPGQILFDEIDLNLPTGDTVNTLQKLIEKFGHTVPYETFDKHYSSATPGTLPKNINKIRKSLKQQKIPCKIVTKTSEGYLLCDLPPAKHKRVRKK